jgi:hypothetical protein
MDEIISLGKYSLPVLLSVFLSIIFNYWSALADRYKSLIALILGGLLGVAAMLYNTQPPFTIQMWIDYTLAGIMAGAAAVGLYEASRSVRNPRV